MIWGHWVAQCQWDAACRSLLQRDPAFGVATADLANGGRLGHVDGWNRVVHASRERPPVYVFIGKDRGRSTPEPPPAGAGPVYDVAPAPLDLHASPLWQAFITSGDVLITTGSLPRERFYAVRHRIGLAVTPGDDATWVREASRRGVTMIEAAWRGGGNGEVKLGALEEPVQMCAHSFLAFEAHGDVASSVMATLMFTLHALPGVRMHGDSGAADASVDAVEHLTGVILHLLERRSAMNVAGYMQATYLAALYGAVAMKLASLAREAIEAQYAVEVTGRWHDARHDRLRRLALNVDETLAHRVAPAFVLPALFTPHELLQRLRVMAANGGPRAIDWAEFFQLHPALRLLHTVDAASEVSPHEVAERLRAESDGMQGFDAGEAVLGASGPFSRRFRVALLEALLSRPPH